MFSEQISAEMICFFILYGITGAVPLMAAVYLLLRRGNAFAPEVTPPLRLRRWVASFFAVVSLAHVWWLLFHIFSSDLHSVGYMMLVMADIVLLFATFSGMLLAMLQDRRRSVWPALVTMIPFVVIWGVYMVYHSSLLEQIAAAYLVLLGLAFIGYMVVAIRQYERWLNDNYADLENKKVWLSQTISLVCLLLFVLYVFVADIVLLYFLHLISLALFGLLLWRVETLPCLTPTPAPKAEPPVYVDIAQIEQLLTERCVDTQLYLQHDLSLQQLSRTIGTNRSYLSQYFSRQGITYNTYINNLRINHFISRYQEIAGTHEFVTIQQLADESGYHSYSTFSLAFKQRTGQNVTNWIRQMTD